MKKFLCLCLILLLISSLAACGAQSSSTDDSYSSNDISVQNGSGELKPPEMHSHSAEIPEEQLVCFEVESLSNYVSTVTAFDDYDDALLFFTDRTDKDESTFNQIGYTREYFSENGIAFILWQGYEDSIYTLPSADWTDKRVITLGELRPYETSKTKFVLIPVNCPHMNGQSVSLVHHLKIYDFDN